MIKKQIGLTKKIFLIFFGIFLFFIVLEGTLRFAGFLMLSIQDSKNKRSIKKASNYRILCLGESTTADIGPRSYSRQLEEILNSKSLNVRFSVVNKGIAGIRSSYILQQLPSYLEKYNPDFVITMMGINDLAYYGQYQSCLRDSQVSFFKNFKIYKLFKLFQERFSRKVSNKQDVRIIDFVRDFQRSQDFEKSRRELLDLLEDDPTNHLIYVILGFLAKSFDERVAMWEKASKLNKKEHMPYLFLGTLYSGQMIFSSAKVDYSKAVYYLKKSLSLNPYSQATCLLLAYCYEKLGDTKQALYYRQKADELEKRYHNPEFERNYLKLYKILAQRGIKLICVQYPMRSLASLKNIFKNHEDILFVDNKQIFKEAVAKEGKEAIFTDMFAGDFGHCTGKGNKLLAENIANAIIEKYFSNN